MHKRLFRLFISTFLLSVTVLVGGCGASKSQVVYDPVSADYLPQTEDSVNTSNSTYSNSTNRFSAKRVTIDNFTEKAYIITDTMTGVQYLYIYASEGLYEGGPTITVIEADCN